MKAPPPKLHKKQHQRSIRGMMTLNMVAISEGDQTSPVQKGVIDPRNGGWQGLTRTMPKFKNGAANKVMHIILEKMTIP